MTAGSAPSGIGDLAEAGGARPVAYLGPEGTFTHAAARTVFGSAANYLPQTSIPGVFEAVAAGHAARGVVPIENSIEGGVSFTLDCLLETPLRLCGETILDVVQCLLSVEGNLNSIQRVYSHPQGLAQCRGWLRKRLPEAQLVPALSTAQAAFQARDEPGSAAIASELAGQLAELNLVERGIQDRKPNATRFVVLAPEQAAPSGRDKTSLVFSAPHRQGALCRALAIFDRAGINLTRIESRPRRGQPWEYVFFVDFEGHSEEPSAAAALSELKSGGEDLKVLGSYPRAL